MKNRLHWILWGILGTVVVAAAVLIVVLWVGKASRVPSDAILVPRDFSSLDEALAHVSPGDTIVIQASASPIQGPILLNVPELTLMSSGDSVKVNGIGGEPAISIVAEGVTLRGFDITCESIGVHVNATDCTIEDIHVRSTPIGIQLSNASRSVLRSIETDGGDVGIELIDSGSVLAEELMIVGASEFGVLLRGSWNNSLKNLDLSENAVGISIEQASADNLVEASKIEFCSIAGIEIRGSNDNTVRDTTVASVRVGIVLEGVTGTEILSCELRAPIVSGILLQQSLQNRILETRIEDSQGTGIQLTQSRETTLLANDISDCLDVGISLISSGRSLVMGNEIDGCLMGVAVLRSDDTRILRNNVSNSELGGFFVSQGSSNRLLDNVSS